MISSIKEDVGAANGDDILNMICNISFDSLNPIGDGIF